MKNLLEKFWQWYERNYRLNSGIAALLFALQLVHLYWLSGDVVAVRLGFDSFFSPGGFWEVLIAIADYAEIPAILTTTVLYVNEYRRGQGWKPLLYLFLINSQWLHIFWITDEVVLENFTKVAHEAILPAWLAWLALGIDYLELPVIFDTIRKFISAKNR